MSSCELIQEGLEMERGFELSRELTTWVEAPALNGVAAALSKLMLINAGCDYR